MDEDRKIRFLVAPTLLVASLLLGALLDQPSRDCILEVLKSADKSIDWLKLIGPHRRGRSGGVRRRIYDRYVDVLYLAANFLHFPTEAAALEEISIS